MEPYYKLLKQAKGLYKNAISVAKEEDYKAFGAYSHELDKIIQLMKKCTEIKNIYEIIKENLPAEFVLHEPFFDNDEEKLVMAIEIAATQKTYHSIFYLYPLEFKNEAAFVEKAIKWAKTREIAMKKYIFQTELCQKAKPKIEKLYKTTIKQLGLRRK